MNDWEPTFHRNQRPRPISSDELCERLGKYCVKAIELFGIERCMFESNFPVDKECVSYRMIWNFFKKIAHNLKLRTIKFLVGMQNQFINSDCLSLFQLITELGLFEGIVSK